MTYDEVLLEVLENANEVFNLLVEAYQAITNSSDFTASSFQSTSLLSSDESVKRCLIIAENTASNTLSLIARFKSYKAKEELGESKSEDFEEDGVVRMLYENTIASCASCARFAASIPKMRLTIEKSTDASKAQKSAFSTLCDTCISLFSGIDSLTESHNEEFPDTPKSGVRSIVANITSQDPLERILAYSLEVLSLSLRLQRSGQDNVPIKRDTLNRYIRTINNNILEIVEWHDENESDPSKTDDYKLSVKEAYGNCVTAITNFNAYIREVNLGKSNIVWDQPDSGIRVGSITPLPIR